VKGPVERVTLTTSDGVALEGELRLPPGGSPAGVTFAHPHPGYGGSMRLALVSKVADALAEAGFAVACWNFRGAGRSEGEHADGELEAEDVRAAAAELTGRGLGRLILAGWSFGGDMSLLAAPGIPGVLGVIAVAPPLWWLHRPDYARLTEWGGPVRLVLAGHDQLRDQAEVRARTANLPDVAVTVVPGADHYFKKAGTEVAGIVVAAAVELAARAAGRG
jgi:alpha/beta superfamily hydrolase